MLFSEFSKQWIFLELYDANGYGEITILGNIRHVTIILFSLG